MASADHHQKKLTVDSHHVSHDRVGRFCRDCADFLFGHGTMPDNMTMQLPAREMETVSGEDSDTSQMMHRRSKQANLFALVSFGLAAGSLTVDIVTKHVFANVGLQLIMVTTGIGFVIFGRAVRPQG